MTAQELIHKFDIRSNGADDITINAPATPAELSLIELAKPQILEDLNKKRKAELASKFIHIFDMRFSTDRMLASIAWRAYDALCRGADPQAVDQQYERDMEAYWRLNEWQY